MSGAHHHHHHGHGNHHHRHHGNERATLTARAALASISMALFLVILKTWASWDTGSVAMLGSLADTTLDFIASLMQPVSEPGKFAGWISAPKVGIDNKPGDFEYVKIAA